MNDEKYAALIADYLKGTLNADEKKRVDELLANGSIDLIDFKSNEQIYEELSHLSTPEPSQALNENFYAMLENEVNAQQKPSFASWFKETSDRISTLLTVPRMAYSLSLLIIGGFIGGLFQDKSEEIAQLSSEIQQMREVVMITMLDQPSATDRLKAVNISNELEDVDMEVITALLSTLNTDENVNVRQQAIDALLQWGDKPEVRSGLINSISNQTSPLVLIALADAMVELQEKRSKEKFEQLLEDNEYAPAIKEKLETTIAAIS